MNRRDGKIVSYEPPPSPLVHVVYECTQREKTQVASMMIYYVLTRKRIVTAFESITTENESQKQLRILWLAWHGTGVLFIPLDVCMSVVLYATVLQGAIHK